MLALIFVTVTIKLIAPNKEETPARCIEKITKSTAPPEWYSIEDRGGYIVHPVPAPCSIKADKRSSIKAGGRSQKLILFNRGKAISGVPIIRGTIQLPKAPISTGIIKKKIIVRPWAVRITLKTCPCETTKLTPPKDNSNLRIIDKTVPIIAANPPKRK